MFSNSYPTLYDFADLSCASNLTTLEFQIFFYLSCRCERIDGAVHAGKAEKERSRWYGTCICSLSFAEFARCWFLVFLFDGATQMTSFETKNLVQKRHFCCNGGTLTLKHRSLIERGRQRGGQGQKDCREVASRSGHCYFWRFYLGSCAPYEHL